MTRKPNKNNYKSKHPLERAVENQQFEVLIVRRPEWVSERFDGSESRVTFSPQIDVFQRAFERNRVAFSLDTFFWQSKRKYLAKGEIFTKRCNRRDKNDAGNKAARRAKSGR